MEKKDLSWKEDLSCGIMNLISIEEHSSQSFISSNNEKWLKIVNSIRKIRTRWMQIVIDELEGNYKQFYLDSGDLLGMYYWLLENREGERDQFWCISKHLLSSIMRGSEVGNKFLEMQYADNKEEGFLSYIVKGFNKLKGGVENGKEKNI